MKFIRYTMNLNAALEYYSSHSSQIVEITKPLKSLGIIGFFYGRFYSDGTLINLSTSPEWTDYYFKKLYSGHYQQKDIADQLFSHPNASLWALNPNNEVWQDAQRDFEYGNGISLFEQHMQFREFTGFYSTSDNHAINHFYVNQLEVLKSFKQYFVDQTAELIQEIEKNKCLLPPFVLESSTVSASPTMEILELPSISNTILSKLDWNAIFQLSNLQLDTLLNKPRYQIKLDIGQVTLSKMEIKTLVQLLRGKHAGEIAHSFQLKQTTIESYLSNIKNKLGVRLKSELIHRVINNQLLQQVV